MWENPNTIKGDCYYRLPRVGTIDEYLIKNHNSNNIQITKKSCVDHNAWRPHNYINQIDILPVQIAPQYTDYSKQVLRIINKENNTIPHYHFHINAYWHLLEDEDCWVFKGKPVDDNSICLGVEVYDGIGIPNCYRMGTLFAAARMSAYLLYKNKLGWNPKAIHFMKLKNAPIFHIENAKRFLQDTKKEYIALGGKV